MRDRIYRWRIPRALRDFPFSEDMRADRLPMPDSDRGCYLWGTLTELERAKECARLSGWDGKDDSPIRPIGGLT